MKMQARSTLARVSNPYLLNREREYDDTVQMHLFVMHDTAKLGKRN